VLDVALDRCDRLSPTAIEQSDSGGNALARVAECGDEGADGVRRVPAGKCLDVERRSRPAPRITGSTLRPRAANDLLVHHSADPMLF